jgi:tellurite resistance-related uncharacterized protein
MERSPAPDVAATCSADDGTLQARSAAEYVRIAACRGDLPKMKERLRAYSAMNATLPSNARPYRRTPVFTEATVPAGLLEAHSTKAGAWGLIHVLEGRLAYRVVDPRRPRSETILTPETPQGVVEPTIVHEVEPLGPVRFFVEFHKLEDG